MLEYKIVTALPDVNNFSLQEELKQVSLVYSAQQSSDCDVVKFRYHPSVQSCLGLTSQEGQQVQQDPLGSAGVQDALQEDRLQEEVLSLRSQVRHEVSCQGVPGCLLGHTHDNK